MLNIAREAPDPKLNLQYPSKWSRDGGYNAFYPYRPLAAFTDRLADEEERRRVEANRQRRAAERAERQLEFDASAPPTSSKPLAEQVAERLSALPENDAFSTLRGNYSHSGPVVEEAQEYGMLHGGQSVPIPFRLPVSPEAPTTHTEVEVQKLIERHKARGDAAIAGKNAIKRVQAGERHKEAEGFPATDAGIRNAIQNVQYQTKWRRKSPGDGPPAESAMRWLARAEQRLPLHAGELQKMLGWKKAAAEMKRAEGDIASLRAQLGQRSVNESGALLLGLALDVCYCFSSERQHVLIHGERDTPPNKQSINIVKLLEEGTSVHTIDERGQTCLHYCAKVPLHASNLDRVLELIDILIKYGADVDVVDQREEAPLHYATRCGNLDVVDALLEHDAMVDTDPSCRNRTPLHIAAACGHQEVAEILLEDGAEPLATDAEGRTPMQAAVAAKRDDLMAPVLSDRKRHLPAEQQGGQRGRGAQQRAAWAEARGGQQRGSGSGRGKKPQRVGRSSTRLMNDRDAFAALWAGSPAAAAG